jgi:hypothetical protein
MAKGKQVDLQTHGKMISHHLLRFLHMSRTETVVMIEEIKTVGITVMM